MKQLMLIVSILFWALTLGNVYAESSDELTKAVVAYEVTLPNIESYADALDDLAIWARAHPDESKPLRDKNKPFTTLKDAASQLESIPGIKRVLDKHHLTGKDRVMLPVALMSGNMVVVMQKRGMDMPPDRYNAVSVAMIEANEPKFNELMQRISANLALLRSKE